MSHTPRFGEASLLLLGKLPSRFIPTTMVRAPTSAERMGEWKVAFSLDIPFWASHPHRGLLLLS